MKRFLWRGFVGLLGFWLIVTAASFVFNLATNPTATAPAGLKYVDAGGFKTRYDQWGTSGTPVVLVHGAAESVDTWSRLVPLLAQNHRVYAYDITGYGYSERKAPYTIEHLAAQLLGFLDAMHLGGPGEPRPILVGHSLGAGVAAEATLEAPARMGGIVFLDGDGLPLPGGRPGPPRWLIVPPYRTSLFRLVLDQGWLLKKIYNSACSPGCPQMDVDAWTRPFRQPGAEQAIWQMTANGIPAVAPDRLAKLADLKLPKAVVFGADDTNGGNATETATRIGAPAPTLIPNANHLTPISSPTEVAAAIDALR
ncbi:alpha/beta fold hydrolase [Kribbella sp. NPDC004536]|uniref:alpha/beta fold hydrolase n=1 Tax=Kribbella sp. NPDC004536 TaxID=3364106 RepID=UPI00367E366F